MILGFSSGCFHRFSQDVNEQIKLVSATGCNAIEVNMFSYCTTETFTKESLDLLSKFEYISIHAPNFKLLEDETVEQALERTQKVKDLIKAKHVIFHPDEFSDKELLKKFNLDHLFENMDDRKQEFKFLKDFDKLKGENFIMDLLHVHNNDSSMKLFEDFFEFFGDNLKEIHLSGFTDEERHDLLVRTEEPHTIMEPLKKLKGIPVILEGVVLDKENAKKEIEFVKSFLN